MERQHNRYIDEVPAPSVITFNTDSAAQAASDFMLMMGELLDKQAPTDYLRIRPRERTMEPVIAATKPAGLPRLRDWRQGAAGRVATATSFRSLNAEL